MNTFAAVLAVIVAVALVFATVIQRFGTGAT